jgi:hypothetical protein
MKLFKILPLMAPIFGQKFGEDLIDKDSLPKAKKPRNMETWNIDMSWKNFDERVKDIYNTIAPGVTQDSDYKKLSKEISRADEQMCKSGVDPNGNKVRCDSDNVPLTKFQTPARKMRNLKILVMYLQKDPEFANYCFYGCHCFPNGAEGYGQKSTGKSIDKIDQMCKSHNQCYRCLSLEDGHQNQTTTFVKNQPLEDAVCNGEVMPYSFRLERNKETHEKSISCLNEEGSCQRNVCECDRQLAYDLAKHEDHWSLSNKRENFDTNECNSDRETRTVGYGAPSECCGSNYPFKKPRQEGKVCCGHRPYDPKFKQCCDDAQGKLKDAQDQCPIPE